MYEVVSAKEQLPELGPREVATIHMLAERKLFEEKTFCLIEEKMQQVVHCEIDVSTLLQSTFSLEGLRDRN